MSTFDPENNEFNRKVHKLLNILAKRKNSNLEINNNEIWDWIFLNYFERDYHKCLICGAEISERSEQYSCLKHGIEHLKELNLLEFI